MTSNPLPSKSAYSVRNAFVLLAVVAVGALALFSLHTPSANPAGSLGMVPPASFELARSAAPVTANLEACDLGSVDIYDDTCSGRALDSSLSECIATANASCNIQCTQRMDDEMNNSFLIEMCDELCIDLHPGCTQGAMTASMTTNCHVDTIPYEAPYLCVSRGAFDITCHCLP